MNAISACALCLICSPPPSSQPFVLGCGLKSLLSVWLKSLKHCLMQTLGFYCCETFHRSPFCSRIQLILAKGACDFANESFPFLLKGAYPRNTERLDVDHTAAAKAVATRVFRMDVMRFKRFAKGAIRPRASDCEAAQDLTRFFGVCDLVFTCSNMPTDLESARKIQALANVVNIFGIPYENGTEVKFACLNIPVRLIHFRLATYLFLCLPFRYGSLSISSSTTSGKNIHA